MFSRLFKSLTHGTSHNAPTTYDPALHYNCFVETVREADRQAVYHELCRRGLISATHFLPDGRLQLSVRNFSKAIEAYNAVANEKVFVAGLTKARILELQVTNPDMVVSVLEKTNNAAIIHAEKIALRQIAVDSDESFRKGVAYQKREQCQKAIECYDEAIRIEPEDVRAWHNKIGALAQDGKHQAAIEVANEILGRHANIGLLWEIKGRILAEMGQLIEAGECMSIACNLNPAIAYQIDEKADKRFQALTAACRKAGNNPETDVDFWFGKFAEYTNLCDAEGAWMCLQMAATIGPDYFIMSDGSQMFLLPPGYVSLSKKLLTDDTKVERLRDFFQRMTALAMKKKA